MQIAEDILDSVEAKLLTPVSKSDELTWLFWTLLIVVPCLLVYLAKVRI